MEDVDTANMPNGMVNKGEMGRIFLISFLDKVKVEGYNRS